MVKPWVERLSLLGKPAVLNPSFLTLSRGRSGGGCGRVGMEPDPIPTPALPLKGRERSALIRVSLNQGDAMPPCRFEKPRSAQLLFPPPSRGRSGGGWGLASMDSEYPDPTIPLKLATSPQFFRHSGESRNPGFRSTHWIPACAGMTEHRRCVPTVALESRGRSALVPIKRGSRQFHGFCTILSLEP